MEGQSAVRPAVPRPCITKRCVLLTAVHSWVEDFSSTQGFTDEPETGTLRNRVRANMIFSLSVWLWCGCEDACEENQARSERRPSEGPSESQTDPRASVSHRREAGVSCRALQAAIFEFIEFIDQFLHVRDSPQVWPVLHEEGQKNAQRTHAKFDHLLGECSHGMWWYGSENVSPPPTNPGAADAGAATNRPRLFSRG